MIVSTPSHGWLMGWWHFLWIPRQEPGPEFLCARSPCEELCYGHDIPIVSPLYLLGPLYSILDISLQCIPINSLYVRPSWNFGMMLSMTPSHGYLMGYYCVYHIKPSAIFPFYTHYFPWFIPIGSHSKISINSMSVLAINLSQSQQIRDAWGFSQAQPEMLQIP
jgi:hypothetical protein